ncbi:hypothetical protein GN958_ATG19841, partial [Phytophthora infestans]
LISYSVAKPRSGENATANWIDQRNLIRKMCESGYGSHSRPDIEGYISVWIHALRNKGARVTGSMVCMHAKDLYDNA